MPRLALSGRQAEGHGDREAAAGHGCGGIGAIEGGGAAGVELVSERGPGDGYRGRGAGQGETLDVVRVQQIGSVKPDLCTVKLT